MRWRRVTDSWFGIQPFNRLTVGNVHQTLRKQKQTFLLHMRHIVRETHQIGFWTCILQQIRLEHFKIISSVSSSTQYRSTHEAHAKICLTRKLKFDNVIWKVLAWLTIIILPKEIFTGICRPSFCNAITRSLIHLKVLLMVKIIYIC